MPSPITTGTKYPVRKMPMPRSGRLTSSASTKASTNMGMLTSTVYSVVKIRLLQNCPSCTIVA